MAACAITVKLYVKLKMNLVGSIYNNQLEQFREMVMETVEKIMENFGAAHSDSHFEDVSTKTLNRVIFEALFRISLKQLTIYQEVTVFGVH